MNDQKPPMPRPGLAGVIDRFIGPGATRAELLLQGIVPILFALAALYWALRSGTTWSWAQYTLCFLLAFDIFGGVITNATSSAKRWYHRAGQGFKQHFGFVLLHLLHLVVVSWLFLGMNISWVVVSGGYLLLSATVILLIPLYLQRPVGLIAYSGALLLGIYALEQPEGLEWFLPLFYLKLLVSHLLQEEPYRPVGSGG